MIDLEDSHARQFGQAPRTAVVPGTKNNELCDAGGDRVANRPVDGRGAEGDHVSHPACHFESDTASPFSNRTLGLSETPFSLRVEKDACRRVVEIRDMRQAGVSESAA